jgi:hypothetical protein
MAQYWKNYDQDKFEEDSLEWVPLSASGKDKWHAAHGGLSPPELFDAYLRHQHAAKKPKTAAKKARGKNRKFGTRRQVMSGTAKMTKGKLTTDNLKYKVRKDGTRRIVSNKKSALGKKNGNTAAFSLMNEARKMAGEGKSDEYKRGMWKGGSAFNTERSRIYHQLVAERGYG